MCLLTFFLPIHLSWINTGLFFFIFAYIMKNETLVFSYLHLLEAIH